MSFNFLNAVGLIIVLLMLIPNIVYAVKYKGEKTECYNKTLCILEQIGRYGCMLMMCLSIGLAEFSFSSVYFMLTYFLANIVLLLFYFLFWIFYFSVRSSVLSVALAVIPALIFLISGICLMHYLLIAMAVIFGAAHISITIINIKHKNQV